MTGVALQEPAIERWYGKRSPYHWGRILRFAEGLDIEGKNVCIVEDVITTGGQVVLSTNDLRGIGAKVENVLCVINRGEVPNTKLSEINLQLKSLFTRSDFA